MLSRHYLPRDTNVYLAFHAGAAWHKGRTHELDPFIFQGWLHDRPAQSGQLDFAARASVCH